MKILLIEDDPGTVEVLKFCFDIYKPDATLIPTTIGREGIKLARHADPDGIIIDLGLPDMNGVDVIREIRDFSDVPVLISSARTEDETFAAVQASGADDFITKPYDLEELMTKLDQLVIDKPRLAVTKY
ncbi:MAG: response regulator transcription factor [Chloroflexi bacterium]|jgi:DNA-binding response OmpR family regulator|nr:response regulator transcription factor [Chloroflexota bacterium]MBT7082431.1 response regulator transcription factor [Chloroflexota bacterium]MBT7290555.1 response regulator transcription factor [Chloroflexota bacterium]